jgi:hypothetical protein
MSLTPTYDGTLSRVQLAANALPTLAGITALVQRSLDQIRWTTVRGGGALTISADALPVPLSDYEFSPNVTNYYRLGLSSQVVDTFNRTSATTWSTASSGQAYTRSGGADADFAVAAGAGTVSHGAVNVLKGQVIETLSINQTVTAEHSIAVANAATQPITTWVCARYLDSSNYYYALLSLSTGGALALSIVKNVAGVSTTLAGPTTVGTGHLANDVWRIVLDVQSTTVRAKAWKTSGADPGYQLTVTDSALATGTKAAFLGRLETGNTNTLPQVITWDAIHVETGTSVYPFTANISPAQTAVWLKSVARPFLNLIVALKGNTFEVGRANRGAVFPIVGRSLPVAVTDVRGSRTYAVNLGTDTPTAADALDLLLASGDVLFLQAPTGNVVPAGGVYVVAGDSTTKHLAPPLDPHWVQITLTEVAAPGSDVIGPVGSWQTVVNTYASWTALIAAKATWADVLQLVGSPTDVIAP